jgi:predicted SAM-dependent methyltransferase
LWPRIAGILNREYAVFSAPKTIKSYLASTTVPKLQIGAGPNNRLGWLNTDIAPREGQAFLDATKPFPIPDNSLHYIYAEQVIEHLPFEGGTVMLRESYRTLAPGGRLRLATPDLRKLIALFDRDETQPKLRFVTAQSARLKLNVKEPERPLFILNSFFYKWDHQFLYDRQTLRSALESAGFRDTRFPRYGESDDPELRKLERHLHFNDPTGHEIDEYVTLIVEASK